MHHIPTLVYWRRTPLCFLRGVRTEKWTSTQIGTIGTSGTRICSAGECARRVAWGAFPNRNRHFPPTSAGVVPIGRVHVYRQRGFNCARQRTSVTCAEAAAISARRSFGFRRGRACPMVRSRPSACTNTMKLELISGAPTREQRQGLCPSLRLCGRRPVRHARSNFYIHTTNIKKYLYSL